MAQGEIEAKLRSAISKILTRNCADLSSLMKVAPPLSIGQKLVAAGIVANDAFRDIEDLNPSKFASRLLSLAEPVLKYDSNKFHEFLAILFSSEPCVKVALKMCKEMKAGERAMACCP